MKLAQFCYALERLMASLIPHISEANYQLDFKFCCDWCLIIISYASKYAKFNFKIEGPKKTGERTSSLFSCSLHFNYFVWKWLVLISVASERNSRKRSTGLDHNHDRALLLRRSSALARVLDAHRRIHEPSLAYFSLCVFVFFTWWFERGNGVAKGTRKRVREM